MTSSVIDNYDRGDLAKQIAAGFAEQGTDTAELSVDDLSIVDEFHTGSRPATEYLLSFLELSEGDAVIDIGCGIGGPARVVATRFGATVTGIDLTESYIETARALTAWVGLSEQVRFEVADATGLPFADQSFDAAIQLHVGMNVADKVAMFSEAARVLRPGGRFALYDLMTTGQPSPDFPVPWARTPDASHLATPDEYEAALERAGFEVMATENRRAVVLDSMRQAAANSTGPPGPVGLHLLLGNDAGDRLRNMVAALTAGAIAPVQIISRRA